MTVKSCKYPYFSKSIKIRKNHDLKAVLGSENYEIIVFSSSSILRYIFSCKGAYICRVMMVKARMCSILFKPKRWLKLAFLAVFYLFVIRLKRFSIFWQHGFLKRLTILNDYPSFHYFGMSLILNCVARQHNEKRRQIRFNTTRRVSSITN